MSIVKETLLNIKTLSLNGSIVLPSYQVQVMENKREEAENRRGKGNRRGKSHSTILNSNSKVPTPNRII